MQVEELDTAVTRIQKIAQRRYISAYKGFVIVVIISILIVVFTNAEVIPVIALTSILCACLTFIAIVNYRNSKDLRQGYRRFNQVFYKNFALVMKIFSVVALIRSVFAFFNPMGGFKNPGYDRGGLAGEGLASVAGISITQRMIRESKEVEALFYEMTMKTDNTTSSL